MDYVSRSEAKARGLIKYYTGQKCRRGHDCERYVVHGGCVDCMKMRNKGVMRTDRDQKELMRDNFKRPIERRAILSGAEQAKALDAFARAGRHEDAAAALQISVQQLQARRAANKSFDDAYSKLERQFADGVLAPSSLPGFEWTPELRSRLIDAYVDTGVIADAREAVGVTPSAYLRELERNPEFAAAVAEAEPKAQRHLEEKATQLALKGNDKLLTLILKAKRPEEYGDKLRVDQNTTVRLDDAAIDRRLERLLGRAQVIDAGFVEVEPPREIAAIAAPGGEGATAEQEQASDAVP